MPRQSFSYEEWCKTSTRKGESAIFNLDPRVNDCTKETHEQIEQLLEEKEPEEQQRPNYSQQIFQ